MVTGVEATPGIERDDEGWESGLGLGFPRPGTPVGRALDAVRPESRILRDCVRETGTGDANATAQKEGVLLRM